MDNFFDRLIDLPLFKGASRDTITRVVGTYKLDFQRFAPGETIVEAGMPCRELIFVLSGAVRVATATPLYVVRHTLPCDIVLTPEFLFGRSTEYPSTVTALGDAVSVVKIAKRDFFEILRVEPIFLYNYLNMLSLKSQKCFEHIPGSTPGHVIKSIVNYFTDQASDDISIECRDAATLRSVFGPGFEADALGVSVDDRTLKIQSRRKVLG